MEGVHFKFVNLEVYLQLRSLFQAVLWHKNKKNETIFEKNTNGIALESLLIH